jgi:tetratricopeptide (TPR) repeat protein
LKAELAGVEARKGKGSPDLVEPLFKVGDAYREAGGYVPATPYVERALDITEKKQGAEHIDVAATLDKLGTLYLAQGDTARARAAYVRAQPILLRKLGQKNPGYGIFLLHLARLQLATGQTRSAQATVDQALTAFGDEVSAAAQQWTEANRMLGVLFLGLGKYEEAKQQLVYALTVRSEALEFGDHDQATLYMAPVQASLGELYVTIGQNSDAEPLLLDALAAYEKRYGKDHPLQEDALVGLAALYESKGDPTQGRAYAERAQALHQKSVGYSHLPDVPVRTLNPVTLPAPAAAAPVPATAALQLGAVTDASPSGDAMLLRLEAPVGHVSRYRSETKSWLPTFPADSTRPQFLLSDVTTETITAAEGDVLTISTVVISDRMEMPDTPHFGVAKNVAKGQTTVRRMDNRGHVLSTRVTKQAKGMDGPVAPNPTTTFALPEGPVHVGETWAALDTMSMGPGTGGLVALTEVTYKLERIGVVGGKHVAVISMTGGFVAWFRPAEMKGREVTRSSTPSGSLTGEIQLDLDAKWLLGRTVSMENAWGTDHGRRIRMTMVAE